MPSRSALEDRAVDERKDKMLDIWLKTKAKKKKKTPKKIIKSLRH